MTNDRRILWWVVQKVASNFGPAKMHKQTNSIWKQFYFMEGVYKQKLDAKALKNQSFSRNMLFYSIQTHIAIYCFSKK